MIEIHNLTPHNWFKKPYWAVEDRVTMLGDFAWFYDAPFKYDETANLCEFECNYYNDLSDDFANIDWNYLKNNKSKKLIITHRIMKNLSHEHVLELNNYIYEYDCKNRVWFFTFNPKDFRFKKAAEFKLAYLNTITTVNAETSIMILYKMRIGQLTWSNIVPNNKDELFFPDQIDFSQSNNYFNFLTFRITNHRLFAYYKLLQKNLSDKGLTSFHAFTRENAVSNFRSEFLNHEATIKSLDSNIDDIMSCISKPKAIDSLIGLDYMNSQQASYNDIHSKSLLSISNETSAISTEEIYLTEKTYHNYAFGRPFLITGNKDSLKWLNKYFGFKSFGSLVDESYDEIDNYLERVDFIINELDKFCSLSFDKAKDKVINLKPILDHNRKIYMTIPHRDLFMKIFDGI